MLIIPVITGMNPTWTLMFILTGAYRMSNRLCWRWGFQTRFLFRLGFKSLSVSLMRDWSVSSRLFQTFELLFEFSNRASLSDALPDSLSRPQSEPPFHWKAFRLSLLEPPSDSLSDALSDFLYQNLYQTLSETLFRTHPIRLQIVGYM